MRTLAAGVLVAVVGLLALGWAAFLAMGGPAHAYLTPAPDTLALDATTPYGLVTNLDRVALEVPAGFTLGVFRDVPQGGSLAVGRVQECVEAPTVAVLSKGMSVTLAGCAATAADADGPTIRLLTLEGEVLSAYTVRVDAP